MAKSPCKHPSYRQESQDETPEGRYRYRYFCETCGEECLHQEGVDNTSGVDKCARCGAELPRAAVTSHP